MLGACNTLLHVVTKPTVNPGMMAYTHNPSTLETGAAGLVQVQGWAGLQCKTLFQETQKGSWRDDLAIENTQCSSGGPGFGS